MSLLLSIDTAGSACAAAVTRGDDRLAVRVLREPRAHAAMLVPTIRDIVDESGLAMSDLDAVSVSKGPGSYTGLRIGVSTAKGLVFALGIQLVGVPTFEALARVAARAIGFGDAASSDKTLITVAPSRRDELYWQTWNVSGEGTEALRGAASDTFSEIIRILAGLDSRFLVVGEGADRLAERAEDSDLEMTAYGFDTLEPVVLGVAEAGAERLAIGQTEDAASFEPFYLKEFVAKKAGSPFDRLPF